MAVGATATIVETDFAELALSGRVTAGRGKLWQSGCFGVRFGVRFRTRVTDLPLK